jgi:hypothetical protein
VVKDEKDTIIEKDMLHEVENGMRNILKAA